MYKSVGAIQSPLINEFIVNFILERDLYRDHCAKLIELIAKRKDSVQGQLLNMGWNISSNKYGEYLWGFLDESKNHDQLIEKAKELDVQVMPGSTFSFVNKQKFYARFKV